MEVNGKCRIPASQVLYGDIVYWVTILAAIVCMVGPFLSMIFVDRNVLNPHYLFAAVFSGKDVEAIWNEVGRGFPGGHFWYDYFTYGDGFTQFGLALGCSVALWALLAAAWAFLKQKTRLYALLALWVASLVALSAIGLIRGH